MSPDLRETSLDKLVALNSEYYYYSLPLAAKQLGDIDRLPKSMKVLLENLLRHVDGDTVQVDDLKAIVAWLQTGHADREIAYRPARVLMQDFTGVPAVVDLAAMREAVRRLGGNVDQVNPLSPVDLVIDHSVTVDEFGDDNAFEDNVRIEMQRNHERYTFLRWGQKAFNRFRVVPPGTGICHQVNLEYLGQTVWHSDESGRRVAYPDTLVGTDSHTTMINGLGILGWGVGGIEAEAAMLGQPVSMLIPDVVGFKLTGKLREGITATDLVLTVTQMLRKHGVVGKFVEFYGDGLADLPLADRATIANMSPEFGATCGFFPVDDVTLGYMKLSGRSAEQIALVEAYAKAQGMWRNPGDEPVFTSSLALDMSTVEASLAGPKRPQDRVALPNVPQAFKAATELDIGGHKAKTDSKTFTLDGQQHELRDGAVVIAAITSCTNTSNPSVMMAAGLLAKNAVKKGLRSKPWVKTSLAPGSKVVTDYFDSAKLTAYLEELGFNLVGYGCTTCIGNSGPLPDPIEQAIKEGDLTVGAVLSGNRNFEGRIHPLVKTNWLASPPLVVAYALAGSMKIDLTKEPLGEGNDGQPVYLKDIWPSSRDIAQAVEEVRTEMFHKEYGEVFDGDANWQAIQVTGSATYQWQEDSTYIRHPPFFSTMKVKPDPVQDIKDARILAILADSVTTDHISPAGNIKRDSPAGRYLSEHGVAPQDFNSYGSRRGNHEVMMRGTFANIRIRNEMVPGVEGGYTRHIPSQQQLSIYDAAMQYQQEKVPLAVIAGKEYGSGSSRDWAAKGPRLLGVRVVIAESFERIHRSNLIGMGILPLEFPQGVTRKTLGLTGDEQISVGGLQQLQPGQTVPVHINYADGRKEVVDTRCRIDTGNELTYYENDGILHYVIRKML
ncbi:aconitate hydratase AcnA [Serratia marcescens]|jgi:aconitate hydratase|uniref:aconitate hydratase AcnA n=1 Tax=Serratia marcescens TaxID=615 RepID=UPI0013D8EF6B|nr:aconitate hydratase AcnA [Serratia marcescens]MBH3204918.1 aconitate hydratase AcnA [Serratia marcescens]MBH3300118.1 aconitate hydratase AcnA [Serratia marcescens]MEB5610172.1 aconitate hydratase AcnA [Serratia marcescens]HBK4606457.1 aconitate hydratase AcnA [Serratia marcescens]HBK4671900.1 aconitate hydratase AcnA [Serratia marcescens]